MVLTGTQLKEHALTKFFLEIKFLTSVFQVGARLTALSTNQIEAQEILTNRRARKHQSINLKVHFSYRRQLLSSIKKRDWQKV